MDRIHGRASLPAEEEARLMDDTPSNNIECLYRIRVRRDLSSPSVEVARIEMDGTITINMSVDRLELQTALRLALQEIYNRTKNVSA